MNWRRFGAVAWVLSLQYYIVQVITAQAWSTPYSWADNTISDLANTVCGPYGDRVVCSPYHDAMNISFIMLGVTMIIGALLLAPSWPRERVLFMGYVCMSLSGIGTILVGLYPENTVASMHVLGAALAFFFGNVGMVLISLRLMLLPTWLRYSSIVAGCVALVCLGLFVAGHYLGLGIGGLERIVGYPQSVWMILVGLVLVLRKKDS